MIVVIAGTNRPGSTTLKVARRAEAGLRALGAEVVFIDLQDLPGACASGDAYRVKPPAIAAWQAAVLAAKGILSVIPEYNGSFPGVYKLFIDMLKFPESLVDVPAGFIGVSSGEWGALRPVEHAQMVFQYRHAPLYGRRIFLKTTRDTLDADGKPKDPALSQRFDDFLKGFLDFCVKNR
jgi:chromate reductase, NAD(P)H dehydrogenase (quinone)